MEIPIWAVLVAGLVGGGFLGAFGVLVAGIHCDDRHMTLKSRPSGRLTAAARCWLGVSVRQQEQSATDYEGR